MVTRQGELQRVLSELRDDLGDPHWVALVDERGLVLACVPDEPPVDIERVSAMTAALTISGERVVDEIEGGVLRYVGVAGALRQQLIVILSNELVVSLGLDPVVNPRSTFKSLARWAPEILKALEMRLVLE
jgi:predicted regulator of Ras-like GTPase activity (Roadblock/LC7/MglB family)